MMVCVGSLRIKVVISARYYMKTRYRHTKLRFAMGAFGPKDHFDGDIAHDQPAFVDY